MVSLPEDFTAYTRELMGKERFSRFLAAFDEEPPVSIRLNPKKWLSGKTPLGSAALPCKEHSAIPWCPQGSYLPTRPNFTFDPLFHAGCYYVQEAASMFLWSLMSLPMADGKLPGGKCLDLCAAPGGKSTLLRSLLPDDCMLYSNEPVPQRASILSENIRKWGHPGCIVTNNNPRDYVRAGLTFDIILCDVPCSGEGMFRKAPQTVGEWSLRNVEKCRRLQRDIVSDAWQCLKSGGILIYSTCTFNTKENEENILWMLDTFNATLLSVPAQPEWGITGSLLPGFSGPVYRFIPGITRSEGLFMAVLRKGDGNERRGKQRQQLKVIFDGTQPKAPSTVLVDLDYPTAIAYLRGEAITLPPDTPRGLITVTFLGQHLGQVKNIGTRANNLYPKEWRIKSTHVPAAYEPVVKLT